MYFHMIMGTVGMVMTGLVLINYFTLVYDAQGYGLGIIGYALTNSYIFYLEKKAGISTKIVWSQSILGVLTLGIAAYFLYL
ncbi:hypothetical protein BSG1_04905 [Bacillus sp. SG-1]|nr:hypothetical protein BSG1_04905 [Bacillus sp. SG-1]